MMTMASWAVILSGLILVVSFAIPSKRDRPRDMEYFDDAENSTDSVKTNSSPEKEKGSKDSSQLLKRSKVDYPETVKRTNSSNSFPTKTGSTKYHGTKGLVEEVGVLNENLSTNESVFHLVRMLFNQRFKLNTNSSAEETLRKTNEEHSKLLDTTSNISSTARSRMASVLSIITLFSGNLDEKQTHSEPHTNHTHPDATTSSPSDVTEDLTSCIHVDGYEEYKWIRMVNFCPSGWSNETVLYLCKEALINDYVMTDTPVQDRRGVVYANRFCALCNDVRKIRKWKIAWTCENPYPVAALFQTKPTHDLMQMVTSLRQGAAPCKLMRTPAIPETIESCPEVSVRDNHQMPIINAGNYVRPGTGYPVSLNILMNFDFSGKTHIMFEDYYAQENAETKLCPEDNFVWDGESGRCREVVCAKGFHFDDTFTTCIQDEDKTEEEVMTDLSQLAQSNDIERVTLTVEVPSSYVPSSR